MDDHTNGIGRRWEDRTLGERVAVLEAEIAGLKTELHGARQDIKNLLELANRGRGGLFTLMSISGIVGGVVSWVASHFVKLVA